MNMKFVTIGEDVAENFIVVLFFQPIFGSTMPSLIVGGSNKWKGLHNDFKTLNWGIINGGRWGNLRKKSKFHQKVA